MKGLLHIWTPESGLPDELNDVWIGGHRGWLIAADTADVAVHGHVAEFPSDEPTVIAQFPVKNGKPPKHWALYDGPCVDAEFEGFQANIRVQQQACRSRLIPQHMVRIL